MLVAADAYWIGLGAFVAGIGSLLSGLAALRTARTAASHEQFAQEQARALDEAEP